MLSYCFTDNNFTYNIRVLFLEKLITKNNMIWVMATTAQIKPMEIMFKCIKNTPYPCNNCCLRVIQVKNLKMLAIAKAIHKKRHLHVFLNLRASVSPLTALQLRTRMRPEHVSTPFSLPSPHFPRE